ncbi:MAG TPA: serine/threonine-protein kinase, partial [Coleofasciculaceae cyanobacterium]
TNANHSVLGKFLNGRYQIVQVLSKGAFGQTYLAEDTWLLGTSQCVIKHLQPKGNHEKQWQFSYRQFVNEAEIQQRVNDHDQIPKLLDCFEDRQGFYLVQELIEGEPLIAELPISQYHGKTWSDCQCVELLSDVLGILDYIHNQGVIHGDLKPSNLIRRFRDGKLVLIDFGGSSQIQPTSGKRRLSLLTLPTSPSLGYIPPEQLGGQPFPGSDLFALGMIAIQTLTGLNPAQLQIDPKTAEVNWRRQAAVSDALACIIERMVRYNINDRYQSATDVLIVLNRLVIRSEEQAMHNEEFSEQSVSDWSTDVKPSIALTDEQQLAQGLHRVSPKPSLADASGQDNTLSTSDPSHVNSNAKTSDLARELAISFLPKLPPLLTGISAGVATSNALVISFGLYSLFHATPANPGLDLLEQATEQYQAGNFEQAITLAQSIPNTSSAYEDSLAATQKWRQEWNKAEAQFKAVEQAFNEQRWQDVLNEADKTPNIAFWQQKIEPLVEKAKPQLEVEAQQLLQQAYQRAAQRDFTGAITLIKQIHSETPTGASIQPKLAEYSRKQQIKANYSLQQAYHRAAENDFVGALKYLSEIPQSTPVYEKAQVKMAEYSQKQIMREEVQRQATLAANLPKEEIKVTKVSPSPTPKTASKNLNPGTHLREVAPKSVPATVTR